MAKPPKPSELSHEESSHEAPIEDAQDADVNSSTSIQGQASHPFYYEFPLIVDSEESFLPSTSNSSAPDQLSEDFLTA